LSFKYAVKPTFLGVPSDLLSTDARCLVIILGMQCNRPMVDFYCAILCMPLSCICPSVCLCMCVSVTLRYCVKTAKRRITQIIPHDRPGTLVFKWDVLYHSCRISTDMCVVRSLCHSRASCLSQFLMHEDICESSFFPLSDAFLLVLKLISFGL